MGIAKFYSWLRNKNYREAIQRYVPQNVSSFSFDLNGLIHNVAQKVYAYGEGDDPVRRALIERMDPRLLEAEFHLAVGTKLSEVITAVAPQDTLVLAVDGVAPQAKIAQQRQRRFRAALDSSGDSVFNSSAITPGTEFMKRLDNYIQRWIVASKNALPGKVIYSSHMVPGEGEHKIFAMMRSGDITGDGAHVVYGMDADLTMLSMLAPLDRIYLMREDLRDVIDIDNLKAGIREELASETAVSDFVVMIFLLGNDFLPHLPTLNDMEEAIETMIRMYTMSSVPLTNSEGINKEGLHRFLYAMGKEEPRLLELESEREVMFPSRMMQAATEKTTEMQMGKDEGKVVRKSTFNQNIFRSAWYENVFGLKGPRAKYIFAKLMPEYIHGVTNAKVVSMTKDYLDGIYWVYRYYSMGKDFVNNDYVYRYLYAPLIADIAGVSEKYISTPETYKENIYAKEINPVHQLLSVLPLKSKDLLPYEVAHLMDNNSMIGDYFPTEEILERDGYNTEWQGTLLINFVDIGRIMDAVERTSVFTPDRLKEFSPVLTIVLIKDKNAMEMDQRAKKFKTSLQRQQGRGRGYQPRDDINQSQGRGYQQREGGRGYQQREGGRGYQQREGGRGYQQREGGRGYQPRDNTQGGRGRGYGRGRGRGNYQGSNQPRETGSTAPTSVPIVPLPSLTSLPPIKKNPLPVPKFEI